MLLLLTLLAAAPPEGPVPASLHGRWRITAEMVEGVTIPEARHRDLRIEIDAGSLRLRDGDAVLECKAGVEPNLRVLAITPRSGSKADRPFVGIYFVSGDLLRICLPREPGLEPPTDLSARAGSGRILITLRRAE